MLMEYVVVEWSCYWTFTNVNKTLSRNNFMNEDCLVMCVTIGMNVILIPTVVYNELLKRPAKKRFKNK